MSLFKSEIKQVLYSFQNMSNYAIAWYMQNKENETELWGFGFILNRLFFRRKNNSKSFLNLENPLVIGVYLDYYNSLGCYMQLNKGN